MEGHSNQSIQDEYHCERERESISVLLNVAEKKFHVGSYINGTITLYVPQSAANCNEFSGIRLLLEGQERIGISIEGVNYLPVHHAEKDLVTIEKEIVRFKNPLVPGQHDFPFCWKLSKSLPSSIRRKEAEDSSTCELYYHLTAYICPIDDKTYEQAGCKSPYPVINCVLPIRIAGSICIKNNDVGNDGTCIEPKLFKIKSCLLNKGCIELGFDMDKTIVSPNSTITVGITGRNQSSMPVKHLLVEWIERIEWGIVGFERVRQRVLSEATVAVDQLPSWQKRNRKETVRHDRVSVKLHTNGNATDSYDGELIQVCHFIQVTVITKGKFVTRPKKKALLISNRLRQPKENAPPVMVEATPLLDNHDLQHQNCSIPEAIPIHLETVYPETEKERFFYDFDGLSCLSTPYPLISQ